MFSYFLLSFDFFIEHSAALLLFAECVDFALKSLLAWKILSKRPQNTLARLIGVVLISEIATNFSWIISLLHANSIFFIEYRFRLFLIRLAWGLFAIELAALALFIRHLIKIPIRKSYFTLARIGILGICSAYYSILAFINFNTFNHNQRPPFELITFKFVVLWGIVIAIIPEIFMALLRLKHNSLPKILHHQASAFIFFIAIPKLTFEFFYNDPVELFWPIFSTIAPKPNFLVAALSALLMTYAIYFTARRMMGLRFLNLQPHVGSAPKFNFINDFRSVLDELGQVTSLYELRYISQRFFSNAFNIAPESVELIIRHEPFQIEASPTQRSNAVERLEQDLANAEQSALLTALHEGPVIVRDELEFSAFYEPTATRTAAIELLHALNADIIVPIIDVRKGVLATIVVAHNARPKKLFGISEYYEMQVYGRYLATVIHLLQTRSLEQVLIHEKELSEELYLKHQEITQYKESIRSFIGEEHQAVGILLYKGRDFVVVNEAAEEITTGIDLAKHEGLPLTKTLRALIRHVQQYKTPQVQITISPEGERIVARALQIDASVLIVLQRADISTMLQEHTRLLKDPSQWDYLLYLETTRTGRLINELIPGKGPTLLQAKLALLKAALSNRATLLRMAREDLMPTVEVLHHVSLRRNLYTLSAESPEKHGEYAMRLFGINRIMAQNDAEGLLEKAHEHGTVFIDGIENLSIETQKQLHDFIRSGSFRVYRGDRIVVSSARVICSTTQDLAALIGEGQFSPLLYHELQKNSFALPSILTLPAAEITTAIDDVAAKYTADGIVADGLSLTERDKERCLAQQPVSLHELRERIRTLMLSKSNGEEPRTSNSGTNSGDPTVQAAVRLGKQALRDQALMTLLWNKFQNQTRIATLLGVNRSSVNRRCREYGLISE